MLGRIKNPAALPPLLTALHGEFFTVRAASAFALGVIGDRSALEPLLTALKDPEASVRAAAVVAVGMFNLPATFEGIATLLLEDPKTEVRQAAARALGGTHNSAALPLLMEALHDSFWWYEREPAANDLLDAIESMGEPAVDPLIESLADPEGTIRRFAASLLGKMRAAKAIPALGMALYDLHHEVGAVAAVALGSMGAGSLDELELAARHPEPQIRQHAARGLAGIDDPRSASLLLELLNDFEQLVRMQAVPGLAAQGDPLAIAALMQTAGDRSDRELQALARAALRSLNLEA
jgi:HEAT repeat protein